MGRYLWTIYSWLCLKGYSIDRNNNFGVDHWKIASRISVYDRHYNRNGFSVKKISIFVYNRKWKSSHISYLCMFIFGLVDRKGVNCIIFFFVSQLYKQNLCQIFKWFSVPTSGVSQRRKLHCTKMLVKGT